MAVSLFPKGMRLNLRFLSVALFSLSLMILDHQTSYFSWARQSILTLMSPFYHVTLTPIRWFEESQLFFKDRTLLLLERDAFSSENQTLHVKMQQFEAMRSENTRLRALLHAAPRTLEHVLVADVVGFNPDPFVHELTLNKGKSSGVFVGQVVLDSKGLVGQVIQVAWKTSIVLLVTDAAHSLPIENKRTHARGILSGTGGSDMALMYMTSTADVAVGDVLLTSALGGRFPEGYPVGIIEQIIRNGNGPFLKIRVGAIADLNKAHELLLIHSTESSGEPNDPVKS